MKKISLLFLFSFILFSCELNDFVNNPITENDGIPLISKVFIGGEIYAEYSYNNANLVTEEKSKFHYSSHSYNNSNQLVKSDHYWDMRIASSSSNVLEEAMDREEWVSPDNTPVTVSHILDYKSVNNTVIKSFIRTSGGGSDFVKYLYEDDRIVRATGYYNGVISNYTEYSYDEKGNITREERYNYSSSGIAELSTTTEYEYDNLHNPWQAFRRLLTPGIYTNPNNITKETYTLNFEVDPFIEKIQVSEYSYEYNDKGYPVKVNGLTEYVYK